MFYNGFNLGLDIFFCSITWFITYRFAWFRGYSEGWIDGANDMAKEVDKISE